MVVLLVGDAEQRSEAVGDDVVLAVLPLHGLALPGGADGADRLGHGPAGPGEQRHVHLLDVDGLELDGNSFLSAVEGLHRSGDVTGLEGAVLPGDVLAVLIARPDLLPSSVEDPLGVALLLGDGLTHGHHLHLRQQFSCSWLALDGIEIIDLQTVVPGGDCGLDIIALREAHDRTLVDGNLPADILRPLNTLSLPLVVAELHGGLIEGEVSVARDVHTVLTRAVLHSPDEGEREQGETDPHGWPVVGVLITPTQPSPPVI